jgi:hypothetical protein
MALLHPCRTCPPRFGIYIFLRLINLFLYIQKGCLKTASFLFSGRKHQFAPFKLQFTTKIVDIEILWLIYDCAKQLYEEG